MDETRIDELLAQQAGVVARRQVLTAGGRDHDIDRLLRRRVWARVHEGVYVAHTGPPSWEQRAWSGVLLHWPAALGGRSAAHAHGLRERSDGDIELVVDHHRRVDDPPGVRTRRMRGFEAATQMNLGPPRLRVEHTVLELASRADREDAAVAVLADACQRRRTTPARLHETLTGQPRLPRRGLLVTILADVATGAYSALERRYLCDVERPHGLPTASRQRRVRVGRGPAYRDVDYVGLRVAVELDGRLGHEEATDRWSDLDRDVAAVVNGTLTARMGWQQVLSPCRVAAAVASVLQERGWDGVPRACGPACVLDAERGGSPAPGAGEPPRS